MPAKPGWYRNLDGILAELRGLPQPYVTRATVESLLGVGRRRAQQIMRSCIVDTVGSNGLADRNLLVDHLQRLADGEEAQYEAQRRRHVAHIIQELHVERIQKPRLLVESTVAVVNQRFKNLPEGVSLGPGRLTMAFETPQQALEKLLALAMAISNDFEQFERITRMPTS